MSAFSPAANPVIAMNKTSAPTLALPHRLSGSAARWSARSGNTTSFLFEHLKEKEQMQMPIGTGPVKSTERLDVERELQKHSEQGIALTPQRLAGLTGADIDLVRKILANMKRYGTAVNVGTAKAPAYRMPECRREAEASSVAHVRSVVGSGDYEGKELRPFDSRPGAMDAFLLPSVVNGKRTEPRRIASMCASAVIEKVWLGR